MAKVDNPKSELRNNHAKKREARCRARRTNVQEEISEHQACFQILVC